MAAKVTFDPANKLIIVRDHITSIDAAIDLYSDWKEEVVASASMQKVFPAFRTIGGDTLGGGINAGAYFFLQNDVTGSWRIRPYEGNHELSIVGNLFPEDPLLPLFV